MGHASLRSPRFVYAFLFCLSLCSPALVAQSGTGVITGVVLDASGAFVPGADVVLIEQNTGIRHTHVTTEAGTYRARHLPPGDYRVAASLTGFKTAVANNVILLLAQTLRVDLTLEVGDITEVVVVSSTGPLLEASSSEIAANANQKEVQNWPILVSASTRLLQDFVFKTMPGTTGGTFAGSINGGQAFSHEVLLEGITFGRMSVNGNNDELTPTMDAVSEFKLQSGGGLSANFGATQTGATSFAMKSGTNQFHGTAFWFHRNEHLRANSWTENARGWDKTAFLSNNFGATVGGPILRDRTHFFVSYEGSRYLDDTLGGFDSLPQRTFKVGDFSQLLDPKFTGNSRSGTWVAQDDLGRDVFFGQIYDPATARQLDDGTWIRDPFPGNIVPQDRFSPVTAKILSGHDIPDPSNSSKLHYNNPRLSQWNPWRDWNYLSLKIDHALSEKHRLSGTYIQNINNRRRPGGSFNPRIPNLPDPEPAAAGSMTRDEGGWIIRLSEDWTISPTLLNHFAFGYNHVYWRPVPKSITPRSGIDWKKELGLQNDQAGQSFPVAKFWGPNSTLSGGFSDYGNSNAGDNAEYSLVFADDLSWVWRNHSLRSGFEHRRYFNDASRLQTNGTFVFHSENTSLPGQNLNTGFSFASFLLGEVYRAEMPIERTDFSWRSHLTAFYVHDDWKVKPNVTLNLGLRWDIPTPIFEGAGQQSSLNPFLPNPGADGFPGALDFLDGPGDRWAETYWRQLAPRVGFAWSPRIDLVVRGGYGINYAPPLLDGWYARYEEGFNGSNNIIQGQGRFREDPVYQWDSPYPAYTHELPSADPSLLNGGMIDWYLGEGNNALGINISKQPLVQNWNLGIQYDIGWDTKIETNYVASKGSRLNEPVYLNSETLYFGLNQVDPKFLSLGDTLLEKVERHPEYKPYPSFTGTVAQALRPFPQYDNIHTHRLNGGWSNYHSLQVTATKRSSFGLSFLASYTFSKLLATNDSAGPGAYNYAGQDFYNRKSDYGVSQYHVPHDLKITWIYDLPFGPQGKWVRSGWQSVLLGGWSVSARHRYRSGLEIPMNGIGNAYAKDALFNSNIRPDVLLGADQQKVPFSGDIDSENGTQYLNPEAFGTPPKTIEGVPVRLGNAPRILPQTRGPTIKWEDLSLIKRTPLGFREGATFEVRFDFSNLFNRALIGEPNSTVTSSNFGKYFYKGGGPRNIQVGLRINW